MTVHNCPDCDCDQPWIVTFKVTVLVDNARHEEQAIDKATLIALELDEWEDWVETVEKAEW